MWILVNVVTEAGDISYLNDINKNLENEIHNIVYQKENGKKLDING